MKTCAWRASLTQWWDLAAGSVAVVSQRCVGQRQCLAAECKRPRADFEWLRWENGSVWDPDRRAQPSIDPDDCWLPNDASKLASSGFTFLLECPQHISASVELPLSRGDLISSDNSISIVNMKYLHDMICEEASQSQLGRTCVLETD